MNPQKAGWYDDPENPEQLRYFDGVVWTSHTTPRSTRTAQPTPQGGAPAPGAGAPGPMGWEVPAGARNWRAPGYGQENWHGQHPQAAVGVHPAYGGVTTPDGQPLASYGQRVGAYLLDVLISGIIAGLLGGWFLYQYFRIVLDAAEKATRSGSPQPFDAFTLPAEGLRYLYTFAVISLVVQLVYQTAFLTRAGATPGKMALGISVRLRDRPGLPSLGVVLRRLVLPLGLGVLGLLPIVGNVTAVVSLLDLLWPAWDDKRQALHDKIAGTNVVVGRPDRGAGSAPGGGWPGS